MTKIVLSILLLIAAFSVSAWFIVLVPVLWFREIIVSCIIAAIYRHSIRRKAW